MINVTAGQNPAVVEVLLTALKTERIVDEERNRRWHGEQTQAKNPQPFSVHNTLALDKLKRSSTSCTQIQTFFAQFCGVEQSQK